MKTYIAYLLTALVLVSCGAPNGYFRLEGHFRNLNQGEFYIYNLDGQRTQLDTIRLNEGRFVYEKPAEELQTCVVIFPNYSEAPVFVESGATVKMEGDATHLKELKVTGTKENELMTGFRLQIVEMTPPETMKAAEAFIREHPETACALYVLKKFFLLKPEADYGKAAALIDVIVKAQPDKQELKQQSRELRRLKVRSGNGRLPAFSAVDVRGQRVTDASLSGQLNIVLVWATWNYESQNVQRQMRKLKKEYGSKLSLLSICLDASKKECRHAMERDSITWSNICDGKMWDTPLLGQLGLTEVPSNIVVDRYGKVLARDMTLADLKKKIEAALK